MSKTDEGGFYPPSSVITTSQYVVKQYRWMRQDSKEKAHLFKTSAMDQWSECETRKAFAGHWQVAIKEIPEYQKCELCARVETMRELAE